MQGMHYNFTAPARTIVDLILDRSTGRLCRYVDAKLGTTTVCNFRVSLSLIAIVSPLSVGVAAVLAENFRHECTDVEG